ncbi:ribonuclease H2, subunit B [Lipomyces arxii]|uniref:ribonuclease H2, subunit B n=1 Tax=Lipomyces arxii TaxID=56418 RepID=UPI0034CE2E9B
MTRILILPTRSDANSDDESNGSIVSLPHPSSGIATRYFVTRSPLAIHELTVIDDPSHSMMLSYTSLDVQPHSQSLPEPDESTGAVLSSSAIYIATPTTAFFFLLPTLVKFEQQFRTWDDIFDDLLTTSLTFRHVASLLESQIAKVTDIEEPAPGLLCYRLSRDKLFAHLSNRAKSMAANLPRNFVRVHITKKLAPVRFDDVVPEDMMLRARLQGAIAILNLNLPAQLASDFQKLYKEDETVLSEYVAELDKARGVEMMKQMMVASNGNKRGIENEEPDTRKKNAVKKVSNGVRRLAKADTSGMSKLSTFFTKK